MAFGKKRSGSNCSPACVTLKWIVCILLLLVTVAAGVGVYQTHVLASAESVRLQFGSTSGSLAIVAFVLATLGCMKQLVKCMGPCEVCDA